MSPQGGSPRQAASAAPLVRTASGRRLRCGNGPRCGRCADQQPCGLSTPSTPSTPIFPRTHVTRARPVEVWEINSEVCEVWRCGRAAEMLSAHLPYLPHPEARKGKGDRLRRSRQEPLSGWKQEGSLRAPPSARHKRAEAAEAATRSPLGGIASPAVAKAQLQAVRRDSPQHMRAVAACASRPGASTMFADRTAPFRANYVTRSDQSDHSDRRRELYRQKASLIAEGEQIVNSP